MNKNIEISEKTYSDLGKLAEPFETPDGVISRLIHDYLNLNLNINGDIFDPTGASRKINQKTIERVFLLALQVFEEKIELNEAINTLSVEEDMHQGSARIYINNFQKMMCGEAYQRAMNGFATRYFLEGIRKYKPARFDGALEAVGEHIKYYESHSKGKLKNISAIYDEFNNKK